MERIEKRSFWALMVTQFFGAFNDNVLKVLVQLLIVEWVIDPKVRSLLVDLCLAVFVAPFIIFSMLAGRVSDRTGKSRVIVGVQIWQLVVIAVAVASLFAHHIAAMIGSLFLLSMQAAFFSPAKYGVLPELMEEGELSNANGLLNMGTFLAILIGTVVGSFLVFHLPVACGLLAAAALCGLVASLKMEKLPPAKPGGPLALNPFTDLVDNLKLIRQDSALMLGIAAVNYFWFMGAVLQTNVFLYGKQMMNTTPQESGILLMAATVGIGLGSFLAGRLSSGKVELGLVPLGALGMSVFAIDLLWAYHSFYRALFDLFMMGMSGGFYEVPLNALIQWRSPSTERGRILATQNFLSFVAIGVASLAMSLMSLIMNPAQMLFALGLASLLGTAVIYSFLPEPLWRFVLYVLVNSLYRIRILGDRNVPVKGPALLVSNHLSMVDGLLVGAAVTRPVRFLIWRPYYEDKRLHWLMKAMKAIPISEKDPPRAILQSLLRARQALLEGELVCIFAEGQISRTGNLLEFKKGFEVIIKGLAVPVIPVNLDRVWGSIFSFEHGSVLFKRPRQIPYPVTVTFGEPVRPPITPSSVRQAVLDLGADAFRYRLESRQSLVVEFLKRAKQHPFQKAIADSSGRAMTYGMVTAVSRALAKHLRREDAIKPSATVGILLPPSVGGVLANVAVSLVGAIPVNLNYTSGGTAIQSAVEKAGIRRILTSRKLLQKASLPETPEMIYLEDIVRTVPKSAILRSWALFLLVPTPWLAKRFAPDADGDLDRTSTIMFSSGSTGIPKGVVLSHANILANIEGLSQVFNLGRKDWMLGILPFFHSFGFTATLWFPLIHGFNVIYHTNPLDAKTVGELCKRYRVTILLATPSFLSAYTRKCMPDQFHWLRFVITGAERLRESIASDFETKFGISPLEGYGCTELSPVATVNVPDVSMGETNQVGRKSGMIGHPLPGVSVRIVKPETMEPLPQGETGLLMVKGLNVMKGYLGEPERTQEVIRDGWYVTGDIAMVDPDGFVRLVDRLSRFSKIAGEMVPHLMIEEKLHQLAGRSEPTFAVTAVPDEKKGEQLVVLYVQPDDRRMNVDDLYRQLQSSDLPKLWIPARDRFYQIETIPYLGNGKLDLSSLRGVAVKAVTPNRP